MEWLSSQVEKILIQFNGHSFLGCFLVHLGQKMPKDLSTSSCFLLMFMVSNCKAMVCIMSLLKSSSIFPISPLMNKLEDDVLAIG